jgi:exonuclease III
LVGGDTNVARKIVDVFDHTDAPHNKNSPSCTVEEQTAFEKIIEHHLLEDQVEKFQEEPKFSWFLNPSFRYQNKGMRVDHILANTSMQNFVKYARWSSKKRRQFSKFFSDFTGQKDLLLANENRLNLIRP